MTATPKGFAPIFPGWNVWDVYQSQDPVDGIGGAIMNAGLDLDRQLQIWVENRTKEAPGAAVADPANPLALRGDQVQIIPRVSTLAIAATRADVPELAGAQQLGEKDSKVLNCTVRFFNRGTLAFVPWPHDQNYLLNIVYQPSKTDPVTNAEPPSSLPGALGSAGEGIGQALDTLVTVAVVGVAAVVLFNLTRRN